MKIVYSGESFYPPEGGGYISILELFRELSKKHEAMAIFAGGKTETRRLGRISMTSIKLGLEKNPWLGLARIYLMNKKWEEVLDSYVKKNNPDLIVTQANLIPASAKVAKKHGIPLIVFIRGFDFFCISAFIGVKNIERHNCLRHASLKQMVQYPFFKKLARWQEEAVKGASAVVANSKFTQSLIKKWYGVKSEIVYPLIKLGDYRVRAKPEYITLVKPNIWKGVDIFLKIADALPEKKFLAVGKADKVKELLKRKNIKYLPWTNDMKSVYSRTKMLMVPSIWQEAFGRVAVEAMVSGIPCIASGFGGLPEIVEGAGIVIKDPYDIDAWVRAIERLSTDKALFSSLSKKSKMRAEKFNLKNQYKIFEKILENTVAKTR
jgi:glycosyltransferase involved in cell wall biosynthesis